MRGIECSHSFKAHKFFNVFRLNFNTKFLVNILYHILCLLFRVRKFLLNLNSEIWGKSFGHIGYFIYVILMCVRSTLRRLNKCCRKTLFVRGSKDTFVFISECYLRSSVALIYSCGETFSRRYVSWRITGSSHRHSFSIWNKASGAIGVINRLRETTAWPPTSRSCCYNITSVRSLTAKEIIYIFKCIYYSFTKSITALFT